MSSEKAKMLLFASCSPSIAGVLCPRIGEGEKVNDGDGVWGGVDTVDVQYSPRRGQRV